MINRAIILAGGLGTRLQSVVKDIPKPMATVDGRPFLEIVLDYLMHYGITEVVLAIGYKGEMILEHFGDKYKDINLYYSVEHEPLGTGGALLKAAVFFEEKPFFVLNGDTIFTVDLKAMSDIYEQEMPDMCIALKRLFNFDRYGVVEYDKWHKVTTFKEKQFHSEGWINGGIYLFDFQLFRLQKFPLKFSFEKDIMERYVTHLDFRACPLEGYFIDIGIPEDYARAQVELSSRKRFS